MNLVYQGVLQLYFVVTGSSTNKLARGGSVQKLVGPEPSMGVSRTNIKNEIKCRMDSQHLAFWCGPGSIQRQAQKLILGPSLTTKTRLLSCNWTRSRFLLAF
jgi:hypothetical protein